MDMRRWYRRMRREAALQSRRRRPASVVAVTAAAPLELTTQAFDFGLTWTVKETMARSSHALVDDGRVWLIDPVDDPAVMEEVAALGEPVGVLQLLDRHDRDGAAIAQRLGVPLRRLPASVPDAPFRVVRVIERPGWHELALWWPDRATLVVSEALGTCSYFAVGHGRVGVHPMLRLLPPKAPFAALTPEHLLVGHGPGLHTGDVTLEIEDALADSRSDIPRLLLRLPGLLRSGI